MKLTQLTLRFLFGGGLILTSGQNLLASESGTTPKSNAGETYRSGYFLGRGDTGIAIAEEEEAIFYNPAGLAIGKGIYKKTVLASPQVETSQATRDVARRLGVENADAFETVRNQVGKPNHFGASNFSGLIFRRAALGAFANANADVLAYKDPNQGALEVVKATANQTSGATFSLAEQFAGGSLMLGATGKYLVRGKGEASASAAEANDVKDKFKNKNEFMAMGSGGGGDIGAMYQSGGRVNFALGLTVHDVGDTKIIPTESTQLDLGIKQSIDVGMAIEPGTRTSKLRLLADYHDVAGRSITNPRKRVHLGSELTIYNFIGFTGGLNQGYPTGGFYLDFYVARLDLGFYTEEVGERVGTRGDTRYFTRFKIGF